MVLCMINRGKSRIYYFAIIHITYNNGGLFFLILIYFFPEQPLRLHKNNITDAWIINISTYYVINNTFCIGYHIYEYMSAVCTSNVYWQLKLINIFNFFS